MNKEIGSGIALLAVALIYWYGIGEIPRSSLSDDVGAHGIPLVLAGALALVSLAIIVRGVLALRSKPVTAGAPDDEDEKVATFWRALGLIACGGLYIAVAHVAGYVPAIAALILAVSLYEGARPGWRPLAVAIGGAFVFWVIFVEVLGVAQPVGTLMGG